MDMLTITISTSITNVSPNENSAISETVQDLQAQLNLDISHSKT